MHRTRTRQGTATTANGSATTTAGGEGPADPPRVRRAAQKLRTSLLSADGCDAPEPLSSGALWSSSRFGFSISARAARMSSNSESARSRVSAPPAACARVACANRAERDVCVR